MNREKIDTVLGWLKQPSTIKAIIIFASLAGVTISPERLGEIITSGVVLYGGIAAFWDKG